MGVRGAFGCCLCLLICFFVSFDSFMTRDPFDVHFLLRVFVIDEIQYIEDLLDDVLASLVMWICYRFYGCLTVCEDNTFCHCPGCTAYCSFRPCTNIKPSFRAFQKPNKKKEKREETSSNVSTENEVHRIHRQHDRLCRRHLNQWSDGWVILNMDLC